MPKDLWSVWWCATSLLVSVTRITRCPALSEISPTGGASITAQARGMKTRGLGTSNVICGEGKAAVRSCLAGIVAGHRSCSEVCARSTSPYCLTLALGDWPVKTRLNTQPSRALPHADIVHADHLRMMPLLCQAVKGWNHDWGHLMKLSKVCAHREHLPLRSPNSPACVLVANTRPCHCRRACMTRSWL